MEFGFIGCLGIDDLVRVGSAGHCSRKENEKFC